MAAKPPKPPLKPPITNLGNNIDANGSSSTILLPTNDSEVVTATNSNVELDPSSNKCLIKQQSGDCPCTNISIMQLFHEMKQEFPTVPDYIVNQCVIDNCHDREKCIQNLHNELALHPNVAQAYPSKVFRSNQNVCNPNNSQSIKSLKPSVPTNNMSNDKLSSNNNNFNNNNNNIKNCDREPNLIKINNKYDDLNFCNDIIVNHQKITSRNNGSDIQTQKSDNKNINNENQQKQFQLPPQQPQRPTTLDFKTKRNLIKQTFSDVVTPNQSPIKPVRRAPVPPTLSPKTNSTNTPSTSTSSPSSLSSNPPSFETNFKSTTSIQSPSNFADSGESEISVNISLSPKVNLQKNFPPQRHRSTIVLQPDPPFLNNFPPPINQKSYTSLNLRLREPGAQSPIEITAGPGLTYTSSSYDAKLGCQKNFQITVNDQGSMISSSRIRSPNNNVPPLQPAIEELNNAERHLTAMEPNSIRQQNMHIPQQDVTMQVIHRQRNKKEQLMKVVQKNKKKLGQVIEEIEILRSPVIPGTIQRLDDDINKLLCDCQDMLNQIENAKSRGINVDNIDDPNSINNRQNPPFPRQKPPRPPPPKKPMHLINNNNSSNANSSNYQQQNSSPTIQHQLSISTTSSMDNNISDRNNGDGVGPTWTCSMCTFQNHPLLNKCECCENIRIIPGTIRIVSSNNNCGINANSTHLPASPSYLLSHFSNNLNTNSATLSSNTNCAESETNLTHFALPTS